MKPSELEAGLIATLRSFGVDASDYTDIYNYFIRPLVVYYHSLYIGNYMKVDSVIRKITDEKGLREEIENILNVSAREYATGIIEVYYNPAKLEGKLIETMKDVYFVHDMTIYVLDDFLLTSDATSVTVSFKSLTPVSGKVVEELQNSEVLLEGKGTEIITSAVVRHVNVPYSNENIDKYDVVNMIHEMKLPVTKSLENQIKSVLNKEIVVVPFYSYPNFHGII